MSQPTVLVVEDNPVNQVLATEMLKRSGYAVQIASSAEEALALLEEQSPELFLLDIRLPGMDGITLARKLRADQKTAALPIVALSAQAMPADLEAARGAFDAYLTKPVSRADLADTLSRLLSRP